MIARASHHESMLLDGATNEQMSRLRTRFPKSHGHPRFDDRRDLSGNTAIEHCIPLTTGKSWQIDSISQSLWVAFDHFKELPASASRTGC